MAEAHTAEFLRWFYCGFFAAMGAFLLWMPPTDNPAGVLHYLARFANRETACRLRRVWCKRIRNEDIAQSIRLCPGVSSLVLAIVTGLDLLGGGLSYGLLMLVIAGSATAGFLQVRNRLPVRVAVLQPRKAASVIPAIWFVLAALQGLVALEALRFPATETKAAAIFVCLSTIVCATLAWRVTQMPALLAGEDLPMEQYVDERLRRQRAGSILLYAFAQTFVFLSFARSASWSVNAAALLMVCYFAWFLYQTFRKAGFNALPA